MNFAFSQAFNAPGPAGESGFGLERVGAFAIHRPTAHLLPNSRRRRPSSAVPLVGLGNKPFYRIGVAGDLSYKNLELLPLFMYGHDNRVSGDSGSSVQRSRFRWVHRHPPSMAASWKRTTTSTRRTWLLARFEQVNVGQQAFSNVGNGSSSNGNITAYSRSAIAGIRSCSAAQESRFDWRILALRTIGHEPDKRRWNRHRRRPLSDRGLEQQHFLRI